MTFQGSVSIWY